MGVRLLVLLCALAAPARAETESLAEGAIADWEAGVLEAPGSSAADLRAPSAEVARVKAERQAKERARQRLRGALRALPKSRWGGGPPAAEALDKALDQAKPAEVQYGSNGSITLRLRLKVADLPAPLRPPGQRGKAGREQGKAAPEAREERSP